MPTTRERGEAAIRAFAAVIEPNGHVEGTQCANLDARLRQLVDSFREVERIDHRWWECVHTGLEDFDLEFSRELTAQYRLWQEKVCPEISACIEATRRKHPEAELEYARDFEDCCKAVTGRLSGDRSFPVNWPLYKISGLPWRLTPMQRAELEARMAAEGDSFARRKDPPLHLEEVDPSQIRWEL